MTTGQTVNLFGSIAALAGSLGFILVYSLLAPWWRNHVGRLLVFKALAISGFMIVSILSYVVEPENGLGPLLLVRGILAAGFGVMMAYQAWLVRRTQVTEGTTDHVGGSTDA